jgi:NAD(P)-dependent dehydrogenase (short-subunit alcohol dehydrogenase family)
MTVKLSTLVGMVLGKRGYTKLFKNHFHLFFRSLSGHRVPIGPGNHFYSATKFCVRSLTEGHRQELKELRTNIRVAVNSASFYLKYREIINGDFI